MYFIIELFDFNDFEVGVGLLIVCYVLQCNSVLLFKLIDNEYVLGSRVDIILVLSFICICIKQSVVSFF